MGNRRTVLKRRQLLLAVAMLLPTWANLAHAVGVPIIDAHAQCAFTTMYDDFQNLAEVKGLEDLSQELLASLQRHYGEFVNADVSNLECDPDNDLIKSLSDSAEQIQQYLERREALKADQ